MEIKRKISATRDGERIILTITHEGQPLTCPLKQPIPVQNQFGSMNFIEHNCSSKCIGFDIIKISDGKSIFECKFSHGRHFDVEIDNGLNENSTNLEPKIMNLLK